MKIVLYQNYADNNVIDKNPYLNKIGELNGTLRSDVNILNPVIRIEYNSVPDFNYVYVEDFKRYYHCSNYDIVRYDTKIIIDLYLEVDTINTYKDVLLDIPILYKRASRTNELKDYSLIDNELSLESEPNIQWFYGTENALSDTPYSENNKTFLNILIITTGCYGNTDFALFKETTIDEDTSNNTFFNRPLAVNKYTYDKIMQILMRGSVDTLFNLFSEPMENVSAVFYAPFNIRSIWINAITRFQVIDTKYAYIGNAQLNLASGEGEDLTHIAVACTFQNRLWEVDGGSITIPAPESGTDYDIYSFLNYNPYCTLDIFIPFHGWVTVNPALFIGKTVKLVYVWDMYTGQATGYLYYDGSDYKTTPLYSFDVTLCFQLPLGSSNYGEIRRNVVMTAMKAYSSYVNISSAKQIATTKAPKQYTPVKGVETKAYKRYSAIEKQKTKAAVVGAVTDNTCDLINGSVQHTSVGEVTSGWCGYSVVKMIARLIRPKPIYFDTWTMLYQGYPFIGAYAISTMPSGYLVADTVHLDKINCLSTERDNIEDILTSGVLWFKHVTTSLIVIDGLGNTITYTLSRFNGVGEVDMINYDIPIDNIQAGKYFSRLYIKITTPTYNKISVTADEPSNITGVSTSKKNVGNLIETTISCYWYSPINDAITIILT